MDASASSEVHEDINKVCGFFFENRDSEFMVSQQNKTTIKYTRLPDFDLDSKASWLDADRYLMQPRLRRFTTVDDKEVFSTQSLKHEIPIRIMASTVNKRKIVSITEDDTPSLHPRYSSHIQSTQRSRSPGVLHKAVAVDAPKPKARSPKCSRVSRPITFSQQTVKPDIEKKREVNANNKIKTENSKNASLRTKEPAVPCQNRSCKTPTQKTSVSKKVEPPNKCNESVKSKATHKTTSNKRSVSPKNQSISKIISPLAKTNEKTHTCDKLKSKPVVLVRVSRDLPVTINREISKDKGTETQEVNDSPHIKGYDYSHKTSVDDSHKTTSEKLPKTSHDESHKTNSEKPPKTSHDELHKTNTETLPNTGHDNSHKTNSEKPPKTSYDDSKTNSEKLPKKSYDDSHKTNSKNVRKANQDDDMNNSVPVHKDMVRINGKPQKVDRSMITDANTSPLTTARVDCIKTEHGSQTDKENSYDSLVIPDISLTKVISDNPKELLYVNSQSVPNLNRPKRISNETDISNYDEKSVRKSPSFIIGHATVTYTTRQKIDFHVVSQNGERQSSISSSSPTPLAYPLSVVSVYRKEISKHSGGNDVSNVNNTHKKRDESNTNHHKNEVNVKSLNGSYSLNSGKLVKPSDVISTIRLDDGFRENGFMCEQFQRELNFIDSFFESLQYLESCSSGQQFAGSKVESWVRESGFDVKEADYDCLFPKIDDGANMDDSETIAAKSLCLLNLLIRDEQRRAKNLLFVLKMREDALKDFTKSQILWLENKKKQENIDIPTLKKKQRGALLKLHHECGEMQRMRKALLALSEKRKVALLKTKNNIELKLNNSLNVNEILINKKKIKRNTVADRNAVPLKCFDLSSSGCDENAPPRRTMSEALVLPPAEALSAEKSIQTGQSLLEPDQVPADALTGQCVTVDGAYLNILFSNLSQPQIFTNGKQYEVNEEALRNIVSSTENKICDGSDLETLIDQIKCKDLDRSSSPSTARSLVDEFDQYYKGLADEDRSQKDEDSQQSNLPDVIETVSLKSEGPVGSTITIMTVSSTPAVEVVTRDCTARPLETQGIDLGAQELKESDVGLTRVGVTVELEPLIEAIPTVVAQSPRPPSTHIQPTDTFIAAGIGETDDSMTLSVMDDMPVSSASVTTLVSKPSVTTAPALIEAEELRRQQLAIEREIKALEQQQSQLLVVREIPDKPPPPYTPPVDVRTPLPRRFTADEALDQTVRMHFLHPTVTEPTDPLDVYIKDFCLEKIQSTQANDSDKPWDACNLLPQKKRMDLETLVIKTTSELKDVLTPVPTSVPVSGMGVSGARRSDHVDAILFAEWRRREPAWTALHADEADVKNQLFETIFQTIFDETVHEFKQIVLETNNDGNIDVK